MGDGDREAWLAAPSLDIRSLRSSLSRKQLKPAQARSHSLHPPSQHSEVEQENQPELRDCASRKQSAKQVKINLLAHSSIRQRGCQRRREWIGSGGWGTGSRGAGSSAPAGFARPFPGLKARAGDSCCAAPRTPRKPFPSSAESRPHQGPHPKQGFPGLTRRRLPSWPTRAARQPRDNGSASRRYACATPAVRPCPPALPSDPARAASGRCRRRPEPLELDPGWRRPQVTRLLRLGISP